MKYEELSKNQPEVEIKKDSPDTLSRPMFNTTPPRSSYERQHDHDYERTLPPGTLANNRIRLNSYDKDNVCKTYKHHAADKNGIYYDVENEDCPRKDWREER